MEQQGDIKFAQMMVPDHEQAIAMADRLMAKDGVDLRVVDLATDIHDAQVPAIDQLTAWLKVLGAPRPGATSSRCVTVTR